MPDDEMNQIEKLKEVALKTGFIDIQKKTVDALAAYGMKAIPAITEIADKASF